MIMKFEETGNFGVLLGKGRRPVGIETVEVVATAMVERASSSIFSSASGRSVSRELEIPWSIKTLTPQSPKRCSVVNTWYSELLHQQVISALHERQCLQTIIFKLDGATPHIGH
ncbi:uncharacterized protein TNCV_2327421 [Trichonephila clavipes]|nr:uncharacterized protein TNCV_2327421 [Trichonephila clavipes]